MKIYHSKRAEERIIDTYNELLNEWGVPYEERDIITRYGTTHVICTGNKSGKPVMMFHGVGDDSALMWIFNAKALGEEFRLYAVDTIGGAGKSRPNDNYNKAYDDAIWFDDILKELYLEKVDVMGVSHGGYLAQYLKAKRGGKIGKAISMAGSIAYGNSKNTMLTMMKIFLPEALFPSQQNIGKLLKKLAGDNYTVFTEHKLIRQHYTYLMKGFNNRAMAYHKVEGLTKEEIARIKPDVYYLVGEEDPFEKMGGKQVLLDFQMNVTFYPGVGHGINHEISEEINQKIIEIFCED